MKLMSNISQKGKYVSDTQDDVKEEAVGQTKNSKKELKKKKKEDSEQRGWKQGHPEEGARGVKRWSSAADTAPTGLSCRWRSRGAISFETLSPHPVSSPDTECMAALTLSQKSAECGRRALKSVCCLATEFNMSFYNG